MTAVEVFAWAFAFSAAMFAVAFALITVMALWGLWESVLALASHYNVRDAK
jgi:hypothetical protein